MGKIGNCSLIQRPGTRIVSWRFEVSYSSPSQSQPYLRIEQVATPPVGNSRHSGWNWTNYRCCAQASDLSRWGYKSVWWIRQESNLLSLLDRLIYSQLFYHRDSGTRNRTKISGVWALCPKPLDDPAAEGVRVELTRPLLVTRFSRPAPSPIGLTFLIQHKFSKNNSQLKCCEMFSRGCRNWTCLMSCFQNRRLTLSPIPDCIVAAILTTFFYLCFYQWFRRDLNSH